MIHLDNSYKDNLDLKLVISAVYNKNWLQVWNSIETTVSNIC